MMSVLGSHIPSEAIFTIHEVLGILDNAHRSFVTTETVGLKE